MGRLPFDPGKMAQHRAVEAEGARGGGGKAGGERTLRVSDLAAMIDAALREGLPAKVRVVGEVSNFRDRTHWYFDLKDAEAVINCVVFSSAARRVKFKPEDGQEVVATGRVEFYAKQGRASLLVDKLEPVGAGALDAAFRALCEEIRALGWFDPARKRALPALPRNVAVITSRTGAALQDVLDTIRRRCAAVGVVLLDARVQGDGAADEIARAIGWVGRNHERLKVDAVILTRGGGSREDLWAFNERVVAEAVVRCPVPVVAAIGHETDTTIAELVADERAATPTQAAMRVTPDRAALAEQLWSLARRLSAHAGRLLDNHRHRVKAVQRHSFFRDPMWAVRFGRERIGTLRGQLLGAEQLRVRAAAHRLERLAGQLECHRPATLHAAMAMRLRDAELRLGAAVGARRCRIDLEPIAARLARAAACLAETHELKLESAERRLGAVGPRSVLNRGFSVTTLADGRLVRSVADARGGDGLVTRLADGSIRSVVGATRDGAAAPVPTVRRRTGTSRAQSPDGLPQLDLFGEGE